MYPILFKIGPVTIYTYGFMLAVGFAVGMWLALKQAKQEKISPAKLIDLFLWIIISAFVGARIGYIFTQWNYFLNHPFRTFFARHGFAFYGGFITAFLVGIWYVKKSRLDLWRVADILAPSIAIGYSIGRLGCFFYGCCFGMPTNSWIGISFPEDSPAGLLGVPVIPTQLISSLVSVSIFCVLIIVRRYRKFIGEIFWLYVILYSVSRFAIEFFRYDSWGRVWIFSLVQLISGFMAILAVLMLKKLKKTKTITND